MRRLLILMIAVLALSACRTTWQPPPGTANQGRWIDSDRGR